MSTDYYDFLLPVGDIIKSLELTVARDVQEMKEREDYDSANPEWSPAYKILRDYKKRFKDQEWVEVSFKAINRETVRPPVNKPVFGFHDTAKDTDMPFLMYNCFTPDEQFDHCSPKSHWCRLSLDTILTCYPTHIAEI